MRRLPAAGALYTPLALLFTFLWAAAFIAVKVGLESSPPLFLMGFRFLVAGATLVLVARLRGRVLPGPGRDLARLAVLGLLNFALYLGFSAIGLQHVHAGTSAVLASTNPLMVALAAPFLVAERMSMQKVLGFLVAFGGVATVMSARASIGDPPPWMLVVLLANAFMVAGTLLFKRWAIRGDLMVVNGLQLLAGAVGLLVPSLLLEPVGGVVWGPSFLAAEAFLVFGVSWGAMLIWFFLLRSGDAGRASSFLFLNPVLGLFLGALLLGEPLRVIDFVGSAAVALGIYLVQRASRPP